MSSSPVLQNHEKYNEINDYWIEHRFVLSLEKQKNGKDIPREPPFALTQETRNCLWEVIDVPGYVPIYASRIRYGNSYLLMVRPARTVAVAWQPLIVGLHIGVYDVVLARRIVQALRNRMPHDFGFEHYKPYDDEEVYYLDDLYAVA